MAAKNQVSPHRSMTCRATMVFALLLTFATVLMGCSGGIGRSRELSLGPVAAGGTPPSQDPTDQYSPSGSQTLDQPNHLVAGCAVDSDSQTTSLRVQLISQVVTGTTLGPEIVQGEAIAGASSCSGHGFEFQVPSNLRNPDQVLWVRAFNINEAGQESTSMPSAALGSPLHYDLPPDPGQGLLATFERQGQFLVSDSSNHNFNINLPMANGTQIGKMELDLDVYVGDWDPTNSGGYHCLFWLQKGTWGGGWDWQNDTVGYMNLRGPAYQGGRITLEATTNGSVNVGRRYSAGNGAWYHIKYLFEPGVGRISYRWTRDGNVEHEDSHVVTPQFLNVENGGFFVQFGTQIAEGPEAKTYGWKFSNFKLTAWQ